MLKQSGHVLKSTSVNIFTDPITEQNLEGEFVPDVFLSRTEYLNYDLEQWHGHFYGEDMLVIRQIRVPKGDPAP